jgi:isocitrate dehydrogenase kinase/phosphatase
MSAASPGAGAVAAMAGPVARRIFAGYETYREAYQAITRAAQTRFEQAQWAAVQDANAERLASYHRHVAQTADAIRTLLKLAPDALLRDSALWAATRTAYTGLLRREYNAELFETFYNSVHRSLTDDADVADDEMFVTSGFPTPPVPAEPFTTVYRPDRGIVEMMRAIARDLPLELTWQNQDRDIGNVLRSLAEARPEIRSTQGLSVEMLRPIFYRNKGAYLVGRLTYREHAWPIALPLLLDERRRLYIDTLICDEDELSVMFSFTRAYFMVHADHPHALVDFLSALLPNKKRWELYASIGLHKHGKTGFYRDLLDHLERSDDQFVIAPGIRGMVMTVFSLASFQTVFKIIKDRFPPQKNITAQEVRNKYYIVKRHDRVGRMADTQEFQNLILPRARFSDELIELLRSEASSAVQITDIEVKIRHCYTERLMTPLNLFIESASDRELKDALEEYGNAIKQLAAANIFPGDMLLKNFGITRHGRVVFYDYDEICYLTDVNFRRVPEPQTPEQEMAAEPWYTVAANDVFPEEFRRFLFGKPHVKRMFQAMHGELFDADYWRGLQDAIRAGQVMDVFPYRRKKRFVRHASGPVATPAAP